MVASPGRWNLEAGPDFLDARLVVGPERRALHGDVEIHVHARDWKHHEHASDPRYERVVAHVTYFPSQGRTGTLPRAAVEIPLREALGAVPSFSFEGIDVTAYPYATLPAQTRPCATVLANWSPEDRGGLLEAAGEERLRVKAARMAHGMAERGRHGHVYFELMAALGYKHNRVPFRHLAAQLPLEELRKRADGDAGVAYALLLGLSGLLPSRPSPHWSDETRTFVRELWDHWWKAGADVQRQVMPRSAWRLSALRPHNHPARRLAAAAVLAVGEPFVADELTAIPVDGTRNWAAQAGELFGPRRVAMDYWRRRLTLTGKTHESEAALIGAGRVVGILANVMVPFMAAEGREVGRLAHELPAEQDNALIRQTAHALFGPDHNPSLYRRAVRQQGLLQIFHDFCLVSRNGCEPCPLAEELARQGLPAS
jgi:hypothetical protein